MTELALSLISIVAIGAIVLCAFLVGYLREAYNAAHDEVISHRESVLRFHRASMATDAREQVALDRTDPDTIDRRAEMELAARDRMRRGESPDSMIDYDNETGDQRVPVGLA